MLVDLSLLSRTRATACLLGSVRHFCRNPCSLQGLPSESPPQMTAQVQRDKAHIRQVWGHHGLKGSVPQGWCILWQLHRHSFWRTTPDTRIITLGESQIDSFLWSTDDLSSPDAGYKLGIIFTLSSILSEHN